MKSKDLTGRLMDAAKLSPQEAKFTLLKLIDPTISDNYASKLCDYAPRSGTQVRTRVHGKIGGLLADQGVTLDTVAEKLFECLNARRTKAVFINQYKDGKRVGVKTKVVDLGPDPAAVLAASKTVIMLNSMEEKREVPDPLGIEANLEVQDLSEDDLQELVGRSGPKEVKKEVIEAEFVEVKDAATG